MVAKPLALLLLIGASATAYTQDVFTRVDGSRMKAFTEAVIANVGAVYLELKKENPNDKPEVIADKSRDKFLKEAFSLVRSYGPVSSAEELTDLSAPSGVKSSNPNFYLHSAAMCQYYRESGALASKSLADGDLSAFKKERMAEESLPSTTNALLGGFSLPARFAMTSIVNTKASGDEANTIWTDITQSFQDVINGKSPISSLKENDTAYRFAATAVLGGEFGGRKMEAWPKGRGASVFGGLFSAAKVVCAP